MLPERCRGARPRARVRQVDESGSPAGCASRARSAGCCVKLDGETIAVDVEGIPSGGVSYGHRFTHGEVEIASADAYAEALRGAGRRARPGSARADDPRRPRRARRWRPNPRVLGEVVYLNEWPTVLEGELRRAVPPAAGARGHDRDGVAPALLPARREPVRVRRERRRSRPRPARERARARRAARGRVLHLRARRRRGIEALAGKLGVDHVRRRTRARSPTRRSG